MGIILLQPMCNKLLSKSSNLDFFPQRRVEFPQKLTSKLYLKELKGGRLNSVDPSAPTILRPQVQIQSTAGMAFSNYIFK